MAAESRAGPAGRSKRREGGGSAAPVRRDAQAAGDLSGERVGVVAEADGDVAVEPEHGEAVDDRPGGDAGERVLVGGVGAAVEEVGGAAARGAQGLVGGVVEGGLVHDLEVGAM